MICGNLTEGENAIAFVCDGVSIILPRASGWQALLPFLLESILENHAYLMPLKSV